MGGGYGRKGDGFLAANVRSLLFGVFYMYVKRATICTGWCWTEIVCRLWPFGTALSQRGEALGGFSLDLLWLSLLFSEIRYRFFFGSVLDPLFRPGRLACGDFRFGQAVRCVPFLWFVRIASTMCIRGVPKVYHGGPAITVGVRREKTVGNRPGMRENRERASERAGNRLENGAAPWIPAGNGTGNRKSRTGITRYGSIWVWKSGKRREAGCPFTGRGSASQCSAIPPFPVLLYQTCLSGTITP